MARKWFTAEQIIMKLREAEVGLAQGKTVGQVCKQGSPHETENSTLRKFAESRKVSGWSIP